VFHQILVLDFSFCFIQFPFIRGKISLAVNILVTG
jgi:hypothetical protein